MMRSVEEHLAAVLSLATPLPVETVAVSEARGRVVAASAVAVLDLPSFDKTSEARTDLLAKLGYRQILR